MGYLHSYNQCSLIDSILYRWNAIFEFVIYFLPQIIIPQTNPLLISGKYSSDESKAKQKLGAMKKKKKNSKKTHPPQLLFLSLSLSQSHSAASPPMAEFPIAKNERQ